MLFVAVAALCGMCLLHLRRSIRPMLSQSSIPIRTTSGIGLSCLFVRQSTDGKEYGAAALDPLLWNNTQHLLAADCIAEHWLASTSFFAVTLSAQCKIR